MPPSKNLPELAAKREQVIRLRAQGLTWAEIADRTGYSDASAALKAFKAAVKEAPALAVDELRAQERERLDILFAATAEQIRDPGPRVSAIGKLPVYPAGHPKEGQIVEDESVRSRAIDNYRKISESLRRLHGADAPQAAAPIVDARTQIIVSEINAARAADGIPPIPQFTVGPPAENPAALEQAAAQASAALAKLRDQIGVPPSIRAQGQAAIDAYTADQQYRANLNSNVIQGKAINP